MTKTKHTLIRTAEDGHTPKQYIARCGYTSTNAREFTSETKPSTAGTTCAACLEKPVLSVTAAFVTENGGA